MPNVVKGSKQERMIVVPHRPIRRLVIGAAIGLCVLVSTVGGAYYGFTRGVDAQSAELMARGELDAMLQAVSAENEELRRRIALAQREGEVDQRAAQEVSGELNALQHRLAELESDVQYYRQVVSEQTGSTGLMISRFDLTPTDKANTKRYKLVLRQQDADGDTYLEGRVNVTLVGRQSGQLKRLALREVSSEQDEDAIRLRFKYFQNVEGEIVVPDGFVPEKIEISAVAEAPVAKRVDQEFEWGK